MGDLNFTSSLQTLRLRLQLLAGVLSLSGNLSRLSSKNLTGQINLSGLLVKFIRRGLVGLINLVGDLVAQSQVPVFVSVIGTISTVRMSTNLQAFVDFSDIPTSTVRISVKKL